MARLLGIDVGTSGCKAIVINENGDVLAKASAEYPLHTPKPGWSEQNPDDWWHGIQSCLEQINVKLDATGLTGQMHGAVFLDGQGNVVRPAILWNDQRTTKECQEIDARVGAERVRRITRNPPLTGFQAPKMLWLRNNELDSFNRLNKVLLPKDYIRYRLTGELATDVSDASGTGLLDVPARTWSEEILQTLDLNPSLLPPVFESSEIPNPKSQTVAGGGDQAAGAVSTGAVEPGIVSVSLGTSGVVFSALEDPQYDPKGSVHTFCHANGKWHAMAVILSCGGAIRWYRDTFCPGTTFDELAEEAQGSPPGCYGLTFLPYLAGERSPHNDPGARGTWAGLSLSHARRDITRSVFEGVTFALKDGLNALTALGANSEQLRITGGGAKSPFWLQLLADVLETPCVPLASDEGPALGAAVLAGVAIGVWPSVVEGSRKVARPGAEVVPQRGTYETPYTRFRELYRFTKPWTET